MTDFKKYFSFKYTGWLMLASYIACILYVRTYILNTTPHSWLDEYLDNFHIIFVIILTTLIYLINYSDKNRASAAYLLVFFVTLNVPINIYFFIQGMADPHADFQQHILNGFIALYDLFVILAGRAIWHERITSTKAFLTSLALGSLLIFGAYNFIKSINI